MVRNRWLARTGGASAGGTGKRFSLRAGQPRPDQRLGGGEPLEIPIAGPELPDTRNRLCGRGFRPGILASLGVLFLKNEESGIEVSLHGKAIRDHLVIYFGYSAYIFIDRRCFRSLQADQDGGDRGCSETDPRELGPESQREVGFRQRDRAGPVATLCRLNRPLS